MAVDEMSFDPQAIADALRRNVESFTPSVEREEVGRVVVDPTVIGGLVTRVGDEIFDGSVRSRLRDAREHLAG